jgi:hypothetical protein
MAKILEIRKDYGGWVTKTGHLKIGEGISGHFSNLREVKKVARANGYTEISYYVGNQRPKRKIIKL